MPWSHCGDDAIIDTDPCPECGLSKAEWTIEVDTTRTFVVSSSKRKQTARTAWIELRLLDAAGEPLADAPYRVALPNGRLKKGNLDEQGAARLEQLPSGLCQVGFPEHRPDPEERRTGSKHLFQLGQGVGLQARLETSRGEPVDHQAFVVLDKDGNQLAQGTTDGQGTLDVRLPRSAGEVLIELVEDETPEALEHAPPDEGEAEWVEGEFEQDPDEAWVLGR